jgi:uncharacterized membrane protein YhaH (DUF805 family)
MSFKEFYLSTKGRINRKAYWLRFVLPIFIIELVAYILDSLVGSDFGNGFGIFVIIVDILIIYPSIAVFIKRIHDRGKSGWFVLLCFIPVVFLWPAIEAGFLKGTSGDNKYGNDPLLNQGK